MVTQKVIKKSSLAPTVLIAGGAGFIGSSLAEALLLKEARVIVLDNFKAGHSSHGGQTYVNDLLSNSKFALYNVDINNGIPEEIESVDYIFHLVDLEIYLHDKNINLDSLLTNAVGTRNLLELAKKSEAKFVLVSSTDVYKGRISGANLEEYFGQSLEEENKYSLAEAKRFAEALVWEYYKKYNTDVRIVRVPEIYGSKMDLDASGNLGQFLKDLIGGNSITVYGDGVEKEYYLYASDAVSGIIKSLFNKRTTGKIYSLIGKDAYSTLEIAYLVKSLADREVQILFKPAKEALFSYNLENVDIGNLKDLGWEVKVQPKEGLIKTLKWFKYPINTHSFKPQKLIEEKIAEKKAEDTVFTLADIKPYTLPGSTSVSAGFSKSERGVFSKTFSFLDNLLSKPKVYVKAPPAAQNSQSNLNDGNGKLDLNSTANSETTVTQPLIKPAARLPKDLLSLLNFGLFLNLCTSLLISFAVIFIVLPGALTYFNAKEGIRDLQKAKGYLSSLDSKSSQIAANNAFQHFYKAQSYFSKTGWLFKSAGKTSFFNSSNKLLSSNVYFSKAVYELSKAITPLDVVWEIVKPNSSAAFNLNDFNKSRLALLSSKNNIQLAQAEFKYVNSDLFPARIKNGIIEYRSALSTVSSAVDVFSTTAADFPDLIGVLKPKKYLILFQNSNEIRPTGGFIGSYAVLTLDKGKIVDLVIDDIYNPDGQLKLREIKTEAPKPIKDFIKEDTLFIRNANWNPSFPESAETIREMFYKLNGDKFDGVIGVDLSFVQGLLNITGPIFLTSYNEEISTNNFYERTQYHSDFNYTDGSDQKKTFLTILGRKLLEKFFSLQSGKVSGLLSAVRNSLEQKHLLIYLPNSSFAALLQRNGWDGSLASAAGDYLYVVNANLGGTKANYYVENEMSYNVSSQTRDGLLRGELVLTYRHTGQDSSWPDGPYTDYVRVLSQKGSKLTGAEISYNNNKAEDIFDKVISTSDGGYSSFEFSFTLNPKDTASVVIDYDLPADISIAADKKDYSLYWQKQPGTQNDKISFIFNAPFGLNIKETVPDINFGGGVLKSDDHLNVDKRFYVKLQWAINTKAHFRKSI